MNKLIIALFCVLLVPIYAGAAIPEGNSIKTLSCTDMKPFQDVSPLNFGTIRSAGAQRSKDGKKIEVFLSNGDFTVAQMANDMVLPLKNKEDFILVLTFLNGPNPVIDGAYSPKAGYGKPFWSYVAVRVLSSPKGNTVSFGVNDGESTITGVSADKISGTFKVLRKNGAKVMAEASGAFNVPLTTK
ncbi:MAG: hypothetical protein KJ630_21400 [Proteobacteria bacterium]|nr:hypothetical protein [Pseudomonadota bacterium]